MSRRGGGFSARSLVAGIVVAIAIAASLPSAPAAAEGLFEYVFRGFRAPPPPPPLRLDSPEEFFRLMVDRHGGAQGSVRSSGGVQSGFCVRLCDGAYFPIQPQRNMSAAAQCRSFCPSSETRIFSGAGIERAVAGNGRRYADLPNAFLYRKKMVPGCTCNGTPATGVARLSLTEDPTLRPGDIVATNAGLTVYRGGTARHQATFTPIESAKISKSLRHRLADVKVSPQLPATGIGATATDAATTGATPTGPTTTGAAPADPDQTSSIGGERPRITVRWP